MEPPMLELTPQQLDALPEQTDPPLRGVTPRTGETFVLVPSDVCSRIGELLQPDLAPPTPAPPSIASSPPAGTPPRGDHDRYEELMK
jgi:hypothetical protein